MAVKKSICLLCGSEKSSHQLARHRNESMSGDVGFCKACLKEQIDGTDLEKAKDMMRLMNIPFVSSVWENAVDAGGKNIFSKYLQLIATKKNYKDFADSDSGRDAKVTGLDEAGANERIVRWGLLENEAEYIALEASYNNLVAIKPPSTVLDEKRYAQNVMIEVQLNKALKSGSDHKEVTALKKLYEDNLKALGLDIDAASKDEEQKLGVRIRNWETHSPIPTDESLSDVDNVEKYITKWFVNQMKRVFGRATEEEINELYEDE